MRYVCMYAYTHTHTHTHTCIYIDESTGTLNGNLSTSLDILNQCKLKCASIGTNSEKYSLIVTRRSCTVTYALIPKSTLFMNQCKLKCESIGTNSDKYSFIVTRRNSVEAQI